MNIFDKNAQHLYRAANFFGEKGDRVSSVDVMIEGRIGNGSAKVRHSRFSDLDHRIPGSFGVTRYGY
jgi:hypothetical protein